MKNYIKSNFGINVKELELVDEKLVRWSIATVIANNISKIGLLAGGVKPRYFLVDEEKIIRYTSQNHDEIIIESYDNTEKIFITKNGLFKIK